jgi:signal transduction histidine kinase
MRTSRLPRAARYGPRLPRPTARLRLTALYGALFLVCAAALAGTTYLLVASVAKPELSALTGHMSGTAPGTPGISSAQPDHFRRTQITSAAFDLRELLTESGIALGIVSVAAFALGWLAAGRILRPLATITATTRRISATSLHERLRLPGPGDELKELGDTLDGLFDRLEASFQAQRHFVANASHELRTPISRERAMLQVALDDPDTTAEQWRWTSQEVLASNTEQERLIEALLTLASSEGGLDHHEPVDLPAITEAVLHAPRPETGRLGLHVQATTKPAALDGDPLLIERLVANLIDNAAQHNIPGGSVQITTRTSRGHAVLSVASTGPVIPPDKVDQLIQPFQRLNARHVHNGNSHRSGHGLGLSIVWAIATAHGAVLTAHAPPGGGLAIDIAFPAPPGPRSPGNPPRPRRTRSRRQPTYPNGTANGLRPPRHQR